jgi:putative Mg2+ transporter-C (MgtC) family protein
MNEDLAWLDIVTRLAAAMACGMVLGFERASKNKPAGLRTHMLVCLASACFTILATEIFFSQLEVTKGETAVDTTRVIEGVIAGVAFLGAGTIIQSRGDVVGLTTGASIWLAGALGVACGGAFYIVAFTTLGFAFVILSVLGWITDRFAAVDPKPAPDPAKAKKPA